MLIVKTELRESPIHGLGVFAAEFIPAGTVVWQFQPDFDFRVSEESVAALPDVAREKLLHYSAKWGGGYVVSADDARFINHSENAANLKTCDDPDSDIAIRDIRAGEELLEDYREFDDTFQGRQINRWTHRRLEAERQSDTARLAERASRHLRIAEDLAGAIEMVLAHDHYPGCACSVKLINECDRRRLEESLKRWQQESTKESANG